MSFLIPDEDVFLLSGRYLTSSGPATIVEHHAAGSQPVFVDVAYRPEGTSSATIELAWNPISAARRDKGDLVDFTIVVTREGEIHPGDLCTIRFRLKPRDVWDPDFGSVFAASLQPDPPTSIANAELSVFEGPIQRTRQPFPRHGNDLRHMTSFFRFAAMPSDPVVELNLQLGPPPNKFRIGRLFAGPRYDPYVFSPTFELQAYLWGKCQFPNANDVLAEFEEQARVVSKKHGLIAEQSFIYPFIVMREFTPPFPMLIGTVNCLSWYASQSKVTDLHIFLDDWIIRPDDVVFDCGANAGQMAALFGLLAGPRGRVFAFDPFPQNILQIEAQARLNGLDNLRAIRAAVGEIRCRETVSNLAQQSRNQGDLGYGDQIGIEIVPLDDYIHEKPTVIKLDVEGAEVAALRGARRILETLRPTLYVEVHTSMLPDFGHTLTDLFEAIPLEYYEITYMVEGIHREWQLYAPGAERGVSNPMLVRARRLT
jgi:FkbM family methyltransferase